MLPQPSHRSTTALYATESKPTVDNMTQIDDRWIPHGMLAKRSAPEEVPVVTTQSPGDRLPTASAAQPISPPPTTTGVPGVRPVALAAASVMPPKTSQELRISGKLFNIYTNLCGQPGIPLTCLIHEIGTRSFRIVDANIAG